MDAHVIFALENRGPNMCLRECKHYKGCSGVNYRRDTLTCQLLSVSLPGDQLKDSEGFSFANLDIYTLDGDSCLPTNPCKEREKCVPLDINGHVCISYRADSSLNSAKSSQDVKQRKEKNNAIFETSSVDEGSESTDSESILSPMSPRTSSSEEKENTRSWKDALEQFQYSKSIGKRSLDTDSEIKELKDQVKRLKRRVEKLEEKASFLSKAGNDTTNCSEMSDPIKYNGFTLNELKLSIEHVESCQPAIDILLRKMFTSEEITSQSVTGKKTSKCSFAGPRPPMDQTKLHVMSDILGAKEYVTRKELKDLHRKYKTLKERITILEGKFATPEPTAKHVAEKDAEVESLSQPTTSTDHLFNGKTYNQLEESVCHSDSLFACVHYLLLQLFTIDYILSHSVSGQASNSKCVAKPKFDARLYDTLVSIALKKYQKATKCEVTKRVQAVQKSTC
ncbi:unnamed protein product [Mytilus edulis]|uniref:Apple domain-containing protein n=1 Tax=Mytilus edulis TaxID=6550 RepID=A0A8S3SQC2_MYTED|nr:unnamed protein product [Mytilus edulis]